jgi:hypothetical protein
MKKTALLVHAVAFSCLVTPALATTWKQIGNEWLNIDVIAAIDATAKSTDITIIVMDGRPSYTVPGPLETKDLKPALGSWIQGFGRGSSDTLGPVFINPAAIARIVPGGCRKLTCAVVYDLASQRLGIVELSIENRQKLKLE